MNTFNRSERFMSSSYFHYQLPKSLDRLFNAFSRSNHLISIPFRGSSYCINLRNTETTPALLAVLALVIMAVGWPQPLSAQSCPYVPLASQACTNIHIDPSNCRANFLDLANTMPGQSTDTTPAATSMQRFQAATLLNVCEPLDIDKGYGPDYARRVLARFAYRDLFGTTGPGWRVGAGKRGDHLSVEFAAQRLWRDGNG